MRDQLRRISYKKNPTGNKGNQWGHIWTARQLYVFKWTLLDKMCWHLYWWSMVTVTVSCSAKSRYLMPFATTYLCETGFSALASMKTRYRHRLCGKSLETETLSHSTQNCGGMCVKSGTPFPLIWWVIQYFAWADVLIWNIKGQSVQRNH